MSKWGKRILAVFVVSIGGYLAYVYIAGGYFTRPEMPPGAYSMSFKSGIRAIMVDLPDRRLDRRYFGVPFDVPFWAEDAWSFCTRPTEQEASMILTEADTGPGSRLDAICRIKVDDTTIVCGAVFSVPKL